MAKARTPETLKVDEQADGVYVSISNLSLKTSRERWMSTLEALHSLLARHGYHRIKKQDDSQIGGEYTR